jgi:hypothetical protein
MKTKVEVLGYEIEIEEVDGVVTVKAELDGEVVEEFTLESEDAQGQGQDELEGDEDTVKGFSDFEGQDEEDDFEGQGQDEEDDDFEGQGQDEEDDDFESQGQLESFQSFIRKSK